MDGACYKNCPDSWQKDVTVCFKPPAYAKEKWFKQVMKGNLSWGPNNCNKGYFQYGCCLCSPLCPTGMTDLGTTCLRGVIPRPATPLVCDSFLEEESGGLCYPPCKYNTEGSGPACWGSCPNGTIECAGILCL